MEYKLSDICSGITDGSHNPPAGISNSDYLMLSSKNIFDDEITFDAPRYLSEEQFVVENKRTRIKPGDILMTIVGTVGRTAIVPDGISTITLQRSVAVLHPLKDICFSRYLMYALRSKRKFFESEAHGVAQKGIYLKQLSNIIVDVPELERQEATVQILDFVQNIIKKRHEELDKLDELIKARFIEMFGDLAVPTCKWEKCKLVDACVNSDDIKCGPFGTQLGKDEYTEEGVAVWEIPQINSEFKTLPTHFVTEKKAVELEAYSIVPGDIAMSRKGNVGRCAVFPTNFEKGIIHSDVLRIRLDKTKVFSEFMMRQLHYSGDIQHQIELVSSGAIMAGINVTKLKQIFIYLPPLDLQEQFVSFVAQVDKSKSVVQKSLDKMQLLFDSLMQQYFG